ncbi:N-acetylmuramoyl-L-alanine amidase CwlD [Clostridiales bacterium oral taxon 876 str. F0540]|nr:N-acetylmuramoyl-L-alanine amidase CwlD [Clostridiales bacterium oral taxon 876 str. F0540]
MGSIIFSGSNVKAEINTKDTKKTILIDAGHGGYDGGAEGKTGIKEKDINLQISLKLKEKLVKKGYNVIMIREGDNDLLNGSKKYSSKKAEDLSNRCKIKEKSDVDMFISIHQNHFPQGKYYGAQVWYSDFKESKLLAHIIQENFRIHLDKDNKRVEKPAKDNYKILRCNDKMPSVIVECGFLSNYEEELKLKDEKYQDKLTDSLTKSIEDYFNED